jgi:transposase
MSDFTRYVGLDDSKDQIDVAVAEVGAAGEVRRLGPIANTPEALRKLVRRLGPKRQLSFAYEAGPCGYGIYRELKALGVDCVVAAPSKTPKRPGDRIKSDGRDAEQLARCHRAGDLTRVWVPDPETEGMRDLTRAREDAKYAQTKARQRLKALLLRYGHRYPGRSSWTKSHFRWLAERSFEHPASQLAYEESLRAVEEAGARIARLDDQIAVQCETWSMASVVRALTAHRGVSLLTAATVVAEIGDMTRFDNPRHLMAFLGLVPSLHQTGSRCRTGRITKTGNAHVRRVLVEAAWAYRHPARRTLHLRRRLDGQSEAVQELSWRGQLRLCGRYRTLRLRGKQQNKVTTAVARELVGFLWETARLVATN